MICTPHNYYSCDEIEKNRMDRACSKYGDRRDTYRVLVGEPKVLNNLEDLGVDGMMRLK
jgi:hypothetical protein